MNISATSNLKRNVILKNNLYVSTNGLSSNLEEFNLRNYITDLCLKSILLYRINNKHSFTGGLEAKNIRFDYTWQNVNNGDFHFFFNNSPEFFDYDHKLDQVDLFLEGNYNSNYTINYGIRLNKRKDYGKSVVYPIIGITYPVSSRVKLKGVYGHYYQNILTSREEEITDLADIFPDFYKLYFPLKAHNPERAVHHILEFDYDVTPRINVNIQAYLKKYKNLYFLSGPEIHLEGTTGVSKGIEFYSQISNKRYNVVFNYALSRSTYHDFISRYDKTHIFNLLGTVQLNKNSSIGFKWTAASGFPYTFPHNSLSINLYLLQGIF